MRTKPTRIANAAATNMTINITKQINIYNKTDVAALHGLFNSGLKLPRYVAHECSSICCSVAVSAVPEKVLLLRSRICCCAGFTFNSQCASIDHARYL